MFASNLVRGLMRMHKPSTWFRKGRAKDVAIGQLFTHLKTGVLMRFSGVFFPKSSTKADQQEDTQKKNTNLLGFVFFWFFKDYNMLNHHEQPPSFGMSKSNFFPKRCPEEGQLLRTATICFQEPLPGSNNMEWGEYSQWNVLGADTYHQLSLQFPKDCCGD